MYRMGQYVLLIESNSIYRTEMPQTWNRYFYQTLYTYVCILKMRQYYHFGWLFVRIFLFNFYQDEVRYRMKKIDSWKLISNYRKCCNIEKAQLLDSCTKRF